MKFALEVIKKVRENIDKYAPDGFIFGYRISPEETETPGIRLEDSLYFVDIIKAHVDYIHLSLKDHKMTSLNDSSNTDTVVSQFRNILKDTPLITVGGIELPSDAEQALENGADFAAMGKELLKEPRWVQKVMADEEENIRTQVSYKEMNDLFIPPGMQTYLTTFYKDQMNYSDTPTLYKPEEEKEILRRFINH